MPMKEFDPRRPIFVAQPLQSDGKFWKVDDHYDWEMLGINMQTVAQLFALNYLKHDENLESIFAEEATSAVGDGLDQMPIDALHRLVDNINKKVRLKVKTEAEFKQKKCAFSKIHPKQVGLIRRWRYTYGKIEAEVSLPVT